MDWLSATGVLFGIAAVMFLYSVWRLSTGRDAKLLGLGHVMLWAAFMLVAMPKQPTDLGSDWPFWAALGLLLISVALTVAHKTRRRPVPGAGADSDGS